MSAKHPYSCQKEKQSGQHNPAGEEISADPKQNDPAAKECRQKEKPETEES
jgi:hypothetical protein